MTLITQENPMRFATQALLLPAIACLASGCACLNSVAVRSDRHISLGQEIIDLKRARDLGAISDQEYRDQHTKLMTLNDKAFAIKIDQ